MNNDCNEADFLRDVAKHEINIIRDDGVHRHVRFKKPGTSCMHFDLITWPGHLCYSGDMGTYVFQRLEDMFVFFRDERTASDGKLRINISYWGEKLESICRSGGYKKYSQDKFIETVNEIVNDYIENEEINEEEAASLREAVEDGVLTAGEYEATAHSAALCFEHNGFELRDYWDVNLKEVTYHFQWCCYALAWGIHKYDTEKQLIGVTA